MKSVFYHYSFQIPEKVTIEKKDHLLKFSGPLGSTFLNLNKIDPTGLGAISINHEKKKIRTSKSCKIFFWFT